MAIEAKINANCLNMQFFMNRVNQCKSVSKNYLLPILPREMRSYLTGAAQTPSADRV